MDVVPILVQLAVQIAEDEAAELEEVMLVIAQAGVADLLVLEDGIGLDELIGAFWVKITVNINEYHNLGDPCFKIHFRMSRTVFEALCPVIRTHLVRKGRLKRERRPFQDIVLMVLWLMATPDSFRSVAIRFGVNPGTLYYFYLYIIETLRELSPVFITWPTPEERQAIKATFQRATGFPGVVGCIDGTHIQISAPLRDAVQYINRHHVYSYNVQAVVDSTLLIRDLHVGEVGSMNDEIVFRRSPLNRDFLHDPASRLSPDEHLVGDGGYTLTEYMLTPFARAGHLTNEQVDFNKLLSQCRVRVENAFARAKGKWRRLKYLHVRIPDNAVDHIIASFVLHNFTILHGDVLFDEAELARRIGDLEALMVAEAEEEGDEDEEDEEEYDDAALFEAAKGRGQEKQIFIMEHLANLGN